MPVADMCFSRIDADDGTVPAAAELFAEVADGWDGGAGTHFYDDRRRPGIALQEMLKTVFLL